MVEASELFRILLVGIGKSGGAWERCLFSGICSSLMEILQKQDTE